MKIDKYLERVLGSYHIDVIYALITRLDDAEHFARIEAKFTSRINKEIFINLVNAIKLYKANCIVRSKQPASPENIHIYYIPSFVPMSPNENPIKVMEIESC